MQDVTTAIARVIAKESGAALVITAGFAYDTTDTALGLVAGTLQERLSAAGCDLLAVRREGTALSAHVDESRAEEPLCPAAFNRAVRQVAYQFLGEVWEGRFTVAPEPSRVTAPALVRVA